MNDEINHRTIYLVARLNRLPRDFFDEQRLINTS